jgi:hypothetical protein
MTKDKLQSSIKTTHSNPENNQITFYITFIIIIIINVDVGPVCAHFD